MKRLVLCGIALVAILGLMVSTSNAHRGGYHGDSGSHVGAAVGGAVLGGILGGLGARTYSDPYYYQVPVVTAPVVTTPVYESPVYVGPRLGFGFGGRHYYHRHR